jgi:predicted MFS family arabinose efflux permease
MVYGCNIEPIGVSTKWFCYETTWSMEDRGMELEDKTALPRWVAFLFAVAGGLAVANVYYAQPLLNAMATEFGIDPATIGFVVTFTQVGLGLGLLLLVPLGDLLNRRRLIVGQMLGSVLALVVVGTAGSGLVLLAGMVAIGLLAGVVQVLVAFAADLAAPTQRGRVVGTVTSGVVLGILMARTVAGTLADLGGWRSAYLVSAGAMLLMSGTLFLVLKGRDEGPRARISYPQLLRSTVMLFVEEPVLRARAGIALLMFAAFSVLWTAMVLPLSAPPLSLSHSEIGLFGLAGVAGALAASRAGHLADRGLGQWTSGVGLVLLLASWLPIAFTRQALWALVIGAVALDFAIQALHVTNQSMIYAVRPEARSRLVAGYMVFYSIGSALGSIASTLVYAWAGWGGVCGLGAGFSAAALLFWAATRGAPVPVERPA